ncbi:MAG: FixH family protein [Gammaproteobacteria bacterium]|jgi:uncharacterized protein|nr:FixH family protein [Gammaproteobacteria bacterium]
MNQIPVQKPWYMESYVWLIISFPLAAVIAGIITAVLAVKSDSGLVVDDYYKEGLAINRKLERDQLATEYEITANLQYAADNEQIRLIIGANNKFIYPEKLKVSFLNATKADVDKEEVLIQSGANIYIGARPDLGQGKWHVIIEDKDWRLLKVLNLP